MIRKTDNKKGKDIKIKELGTAKRIENPNFSKTEAKNMAAKRKGLFSEKVARKPVQYPSIIAQLLNLMQAIMESISDTKSIISAVFMPAIMETLASLKNNPTTPAQKSIVPKKQQIVAIAL